MGICSIGSKACKILNHIRSLLLLLLLLRTATACQLASSRAASPSQDPTLLPPVVLQCNCGAALRKWATSSVRLRLERVSVAETSAFLLLFCLVQRPYYRADLVVAVHRLRRRLAHLGQDYGLGALSQRSISRCSDLARAAVATVSALRAARACPFCPIGIIH